jgi:hypothetical protein
MTRGFGRFLRQNTIALLALFLVLGGTSYAAASAINGKTIKPNSIPKNRLTKTAIKQLHGAKGARGAQGLQGPQGIQGIQGPIGPSDVYATNNDGIAYGTSTTTIISLALPAGKYLVTYTGVPFVASGAATQTCSLVAPAGTISQSYVSLDATNTGFADASETMNAPTTLASAGSVSVDCFASVAGFMERNHLTAIAVGSVTGAGPTHAPSARSTSPAR